MTIVFENAPLLPSTWRTDEVARTARVFNPSLLRDGTGWLMAYRVVAEPALARRIAICRLDAQLRLVPGSPLPLSDWIQFPDPISLAPEAAHWFADPRLYRIENRLLVYWNSGWHEPRNHQFVQEL